MEFENKRMKRLKVISGILFTLYMCAVFYFMFLANSFNRTTITENYKYNLKLFIEIERFQSVWRVHGAWVALVNLLGNVVCFMPFGFFVPFLSRNYRKPLVVTSLTFLFSLAVETAQLLLKIGVFDVDDLLLNTVGGLSGCIVYYICRHIYFKLKRKKNEKKTGKI